MRKSKPANFEKGDLVSGPGFSGTGTVLGISFLGDRQWSAAYHVRDAAWCAFDLEHGDATRPKGAANGA